ncbi:unnamed protein product [Closterium sp. NIES-54]
MDHAVLLHNLLSSSSLPNNESPHLLWTRELGNIKMLRVFGCIVQYRPHTARAGQFSQRAHWGLHLELEMAVLPDSPLPAPSPYAEQTGSLAERLPLPSPHASSLADGPDPESDLVRAVSPTVPRLLVNVVTDPSFESAAASAQVAELVEFVAVCRLDYTASLVAESESDYPPFVEGDPDAPDIPTLRSYIEAMTGPYSSQRQTAMDADMAS